MNEDTGYYKVTGKDLTKALDEYHVRECEALSAMCRFSRRNGGHRSKVGLSISWGGTCVAIQFKEPPDAKIWKTAEKYSSFWIPKCSGPGKKLRAEFDKLERAFPNRNEISDLIQFDNFFITVAFGLYNGVWIIEVPISFRPKKGLGMRRISDLTFEKISA